MLSGTMFIATSWLPQSELNGGGRVYSFCSGAPANPYDRRSLHTISKQGQQTNSPGAYCFCSRTFCCRRSERAYVSCEQAAWKRLLIGLHPYPTDRASENRVAVLEWKGTPSCSVKALNRYICFTWLMRPLKQNLIECKMSTKSNEHKTALCTL